MSATILASAPVAATPAAGTSAGTSAGTRWAARALTTVAVFFLVFDTTIKLVAAQEAVEGTVQLGWAPHHLPILGLIEIACLVLYLIPRTAPLGAVLWTGYLGGATATHLRLDNPLLTH